MKSTKYVSWRGQTFIGCMKFYLSNCQTWGKNHVEILRKAVVFRSVQTRKSVRNSRLPCLLMPLRSSTLLQRQVATNQWKVLHTNKKVVFVCLFFSVNWQYPAKPRKTTYKKTPCLFLTCGLQLFFSQGKGWYSGTRWRCRWGGVLWGMLFFWSTCRFRYTPEI